MADGTTVWADLREAELTGLSVGDEAAFTWDLSAVSVLKGNVS